MSETRRVALVGAGKCASTIAVALRARGWDIAGLTCAHPASAQAASELLGGTPVLATNAAAALAAPLVLLGVPDRAIEPVAGEIADACPDLGGRVFLHLSGALDRSALAALAARGAATGSLHPLQTFPERVAQAAWLRGIHFALEGDERARAAAEAVVAACEGTLLHLAPGTKARYHAAASVASNHLLGVVDFAQGLLAGCGVDSDQARRALLPLVVATLGGNDSQGAERALTGPIVRGDDATVVRHLEALAAGERQRYAGSARGTLELARRSGRLAEPAAERMARRLEPWPRAGGVVASLRATTVEGLRKRSEEAHRIYPGARLEWRLDWLERAPAPQDAALIEADIFPVRPGTPATRELARAWLEQSSGLVDYPLGHHDGAPLARAIVSWHGPASGALAAARDIARIGPEVGKVVIEDPKERDLLLLPEVAATLRRGCPGVAAFATGEVGRPSRIASAQLGGDWSYACLDESERTAPGQVTLAELREVYRRDRPSGANPWQPWPLWGLTGWPIGHSLSPRLMNRALPGVYAPFPSRDLAATLELVERLGMRGLSVTMPHKEEAARRVAWRSPEAEAAASVNTIVRDAGRLVGHSTDSWGVAEAAAALLPLAGARALVLGAGGSARSAVVGLHGQGARVTVVARDPARARAAAERLGAAWAERAETVTWDLLVNATPVGMGSDASSLPLAAELLGGAAVVDLVYDPRETRLIAAARARGLRVAPGLEVFLRQAARQIVLFGGPELSVERLRGWLAT